MDTVDIDSLVEELQNQEETPNQETAQVEMPSDPRIGGIDWSQYESLEDYYARGPINEATGRVRRFRTLRAESEAGFNREQAFENRRSLCAEFNQNTPTEPENPSS